MKNQRPGEEKGSWIVQDELSKKVKKRKSPSIKWWWRPNKKNSLTRAFPSRFENILGPSGASKNMPGSIMALPTRSEDILGLSGTSKNVEESSDSSMFSGETIVRVSSPSPVQGSCSEDELLSRTMDSDNTHEIQGTINVSISGDEVSNSGEEMNTLALVDFEDGKSPEGKSNLYASSNLELVIFLEPILGKVQCCFPNSVENSQDGISVVEQLTHAECVTFEGLE